MKKHGTPRVIMLDAYAASHRAITELQSAGTITRRVRVRSSKYLNNLVEQDHRRISEWESEHQMHESVKARSYFRTTTGRSLHALDECMLDDLVVSDSG
jgi:transposase-like protein